MGVVTILCPRMGQQVSTGIELGRKEFAALSPTRHYAMRCWMCGGEHEWSRRWAYYVEDARDLRRLGKRYTIVTLPVAMS